MGTRGATETVSRVLVAFLEQRTWTQAELARRVGVGPRAIRRVLTDLQAADVRIERDEEHPHVYWSVPPTWFPGAKALGSEQAKSIARLIARLPRSRAREKALQALVEATPPPNTAVDATPDDVMRAVEDSCALRVALRARYYSAHRGEVF